jgi:ferredoxin
VQVGVSDKCAGHGRCYTLAPEVYESDDDGYNTGVGTTFEVGSDLAEKARIGASNCPEDAIAIFE